MKSNSECRLTELDGVRGLAIILVLIAHCYTPPRNGDFLQLTLHYILGYCGIGVDLFFVLSGYLITNILLRTRDNENYFSSFYIRRALRIFPAYYLVLFLIFFILPIAHEPNGSANPNQYILFYLTYTQNLMMAYGWNNENWEGAGHLWSLAVEEQFYLIWPVMICATSKVVLQRVCLYILFASVAAKLLLVATSTPAALYNYLTFTRCDGLVAGAWVATLAREKSPPLIYLAKYIGVASMLGMAAVIVLVALLRHHIILHPFMNLSIFAFSSLVALVHFSALPSALSGALNNRVLAWFGQYSYGIYLLHYVLFWPIKHYIEIWLEIIGLNDAIFKTFIVGSATVLLSCFLARNMYRYIEAPILELKNIIARPRGSDFMGSPEKTSRTYK